LTKNGRNDTPGRPTKRPTRPGNAFAVYIQERSVASEAGGHVHFNEASSEWDAMSEHDKTPYRNEAGDLWQDHVVRLAAWQKEQHVSETPVMDQNDAGNVPLLPSLGRADRKRSAAR
jgi:hypothetical protein